jgi:hypothetical protein
MKRIIKMYRIMLVLMLLIAGFGGLVIYELYGSKEFHAARLVCHEYAKHRNFDSDWTCLHSSKSWTKRGNYNLSSFLFFPGNKNDPNLILVRYTDKCPTNTFEVGTIPNSFVRSDAADAVIKDAEFIAQP